MPKTLVLKKIDIQETETIQNRKLSILDYDNLLDVKNKLHFPEFSNIYKKTLQSADEALNKGPFSVVNKTQTPTSGDKHDYLSLGPYWWPDPSKKNGLPWIRRDGEINPLTRGENVDEPRKDNLFHSVKKLSFAYFFTDDERYAKKLIELLEVWFLNPETKMNPNLNFAQGIPGTNTGRGIGIIEFAGISNILNAIEILELNNVIDNATSKALRNWMEAYLDWLQNSEFGIFEKNTKNNHGTHYDIQVCSLLLFLNRTEEAKELLESVKTNRIQTQIAPDGKQPNELTRTKALSYSTMNLSGFVKLAYLGKKVKVDLWSFKAENGASIQNAFEFLKPYLEGEKKWEYQQLGSVENAFNKLSQLFSKAGSIFGVEEYCNIIEKKTDSYTDMLYACY